MLELNIVKPLEAGLRPSILRIECKIETSRASLLDLVAMSEGLDQPVGTVTEIDSDNESNGKNQRNNEAGEGTTTTTQSDAGDEGNDHMIVDRRKVPTWNNMLESTMGSDAEERRSYESLVM